MKILIKTLIIVFVSLTAYSKSLDRSYVEELLCQKEEMILSYEMHQKLFPDFEIVSVSLGGEFFYIKERDPFIKSGGMGNVKDADIQSIYYRIYSKDNYITYIFSYREDFIEYSIMYNQSFLYEGYFSRAKYESSKKLCKGL